MKLNWLMQWRFCSSIKLPTILKELDWIWCGGVVRIPPYEKENKVSSGAKDNAKSAEVGTHEAGHWSDLRGGGSSARAGKFV